MEKVVCHGTMLSEFVQSFDVKAIMMTGKVIGALIGTLLFHWPMGTLLGLFLGHLFDSGHFNQFGPFADFHQRQRSGSLQQLFFDSTFSIMGFIAKSDGRVSQLEIQFAEQVMMQMQLRGERRLRAIDQFNIGKSSDFDYQSTLTRLRNSCRFQPSLLKTFLDIQVRAADVKGSMSPSTQEALRRVFLGLGISEALFQQYYRRSRAGYSYQQYGQGDSGKSPQQHLDDAYVILGVDSGASDAELKKAYRRQMSKNHPDRLIAKGVPPEMVKMATQKTQQIQDAYETIKQHRGIK